MLHRAWELVGCCEHDNETAGSIKGREFFSISVTVDFLLIFADI
jgi:hypothetical protein